MAQESIHAALVQAAAELGVEDCDPRLERPRDPEHGDWATNLALTLASTLKRSPRDIAQDIADRLDLAGAGVTSVEVAGPGFLNFRLSVGSVAGELATVLDQGEAYGRSDAGRERPIMVEWVSANPTGPLHPGHGRQAALGGAIASLLEWTGWKVHREFYYNDAGTQMENLARSVLARYREELGLEGEIPEGGYPGEYVRDLARELVENEGDRYLEGDEAEVLEAMRAFAVDRLMAGINADTDDLGLAFDEYFLETSLYDDGKVDETVRRLRETGHVYDKDGAVWLRTTEFGDQKDRPMIKSDGNPTYFLPDVAYHINKWERGFEHVINVQGADHHSTVARVHAGLQALGYPEGYPEYVLHQMVTVMRGGKEVKLGKRAGSATTLRDLFQEVGVDVTKYFFQMRRPEAHLVFDLDVAQDHSDKNPVYKVKYAHARMNSIYAKAGVAGEDISADSVDLELLETEAERELIKQLAELPELVARAAEARAPHLLCDYLEQTAGMVNSWYHAGNPSRNPELAVLVEDEALRAARLVLVRAVQLVLNNGLTILGIEAPERMDRSESTESPDPQEDS